MSRRVITVPSTVALVLLSLGLTGCPLSDRYYVEQDPSEASGGVAGSQTAGGTNAGAGANAGGASSEGGATSTCVGTGCWARMSDPPITFVAREKAAYTALDDKLFIFGGLDAAGNALNDGALYDPAADSWTLLPVTTATPSARQLATAKWSGNVVFVVGGSDESSSVALKSSAKYDPLTDAWSALSDLPSGRVAPYMANAPSSEYMMIWGGVGASGSPLSGGEFCAHSGQIWTAIAAGPYNPVPGQLSELTWGAGNNGVFLFGGRTWGNTKSAAAYQYVSANYQWTSLYGSGPTARWGAFGVWDGQSFYVWGGRDDTKALSDGSRYATTGGWSTLGTTAAPSARWAPHRRSGWMFAVGTGDVLVVGGVDYSGKLLLDGGRYSKSTAEWTALPSWPSGEAHEYGVAAMVGGEVFVWGGRNGSKVTATGERYLP